MRACWLFIISCSFFSLALGQGNYDPIRFDVYYIKGLDNETSFEQIRDLDTWVKHPNNQINFGSPTLEKFNIWLKIDIKDLSKLSHASYFVINSSNLETADFYLNIENHWHKTTQGLKGSTRDPYFVDLPNLSLSGEITLPYLYINIQNQLATAFSMGITSQRKHLLNSRIKSYFTFFVLGAIFSLIIYNFLSTVKLQDKSYQFYSGYQFFIICYLLFSGGLIGKSLIASTGYYWYQFFLSTTICMIYLMPVIFTRSFLNQSDSRLINTSINLQYIVTAIILCLTIFDKVNWVNMIFPLLTILFLFNLYGLLWRSYKKRQSCYLYLFISWSLLVFSYFAQIFIVLGISKNLDLLYYLVHLGILFEAIFFALTLSSRLQFSKDAELLYQKKYNSNLKDEVKKRTINLTKINLELEKSANTDALTGLYNRHHFNQTIKSLCEDKLHHNFYLAMIDFDDFKNINDKFGHLGGDHCLQEASAFIKSMLRDDLFFRYGGEEFVMILDTNKPEDAINICERIRKNCFEHIIDYEQEVVRYSISIGLCEWSGNMNHNTLLQFADDALYRAKTSGKNKLIVHASIQ